MPCRQLRPSAGREHTAIKLTRSGDDNYLMNETRRKRTALYNLFSPVMMIT